MIINLLIFKKKIREGQIDEDVELTLKSRFFNKLSYPENVVHIFAEQHNEIQLDKMASELVKIQAIDETPRQITLALS